MSILHDLWRLLPHRFRRRIFETAVRTSAPEAGPVLDWPDQDVPIIVAGVLQAPTGLGEAARGTLEALRAMGRDVRPFDLTAALRQERIVPLPDLPAPEPGPGILLVFANPPTSSYALHAIGRPIADGKLKIGSWVWEYAHAPERWAQHAGHFHGLAAPTELVRQAVSGVTGGPVGRLPYHVPVGQAPLPVLQRPDRLRIGFIGDIVAAAGRKNPMAVVEAVGRAFGGRGDIAFDMILRGASAGHPLVRQLRDRARHFGLTLEVDARLLDTEAHRARLRSFDVFCSLHRAEGFGLTIAEAMAVGLPVVATRCPAVGEYLDDSVGYPVPWRPVPADPLVDDPSPGMWAEPDIDAAVAALRAIDANRAEAADRGRLAMKRIEQRYSASAVTAALDLLVAEVRALSRP